MNHTPSEREEITARVIRKVENSGLWVYSYSTDLKSPDIEHAVQYAKHKGFISDTEAEVALYSLREYLAIINQQTHKLRPWSSGTNFSTLRYALHPYFINSYSSSDNLEYRALILDWMNRPYGDGRTKDYRGGKEMTFENVIRSSDGTSSFEVVTINDSPVEVKKPSFFKRLFGIK